MGFLCHMHKIMTDMVIKVKAMTGKGEIKKAGLARFHVTFS